jgi:hypothetical protein
MNRFDPKGAVFCATWTALQAIRYVRFLGAIQIVLFDSPNETRTQP